MVAEYLIMKFLVHFLGSNTHKGHLELLNRQIEKPPRCSDNEIEKEEVIGKEQDVLIQVQYNF